MAEILDENTERVATTIVTDTSYEDQPKGSNSFVLNGVNQTSEGEKGKISTEQSNTPCGEITSGYLPIGRCYTTDGRTILFSVRSDESNSEIGIIDKNCNYSVSVRNPGLAFKLNHQIQATYRLRQGCDDVVYFTDGNSPVRDYNFAKPQDYYTSEYNTFLNNNTPGVFTGEIWDIDKFKLFPSYKVPCFAKMEVVSGGTIIPGTYNFAIQYLDANLNPTNWIYSSQLVPVIQASSSANYFDILGSSNVEVDSISGIKNTTKAIKITIGNLDDGYKFYRIAVIQATDGNALVSKVLASPTFPIGSFEYIFDGNLEGYSAITTEELLLSKIDIEVVQHIEQLENKLLLANTKGKTVPYCSFQSFASKIASNYIISEARDGDQNADGNTKNPNTYWDTQGYMGDEVYAMAIVYVFDDGLETPAFHIPGRSPGKYLRITDKTIQLANDQSPIASWNKDLSPWYTDASIYNALPTSKKLKRWQVYDTSTIYSPEGLTESYGAMSYWENKDAKYTNVSDCIGGDYWGVDACEVELVNQPIRHHKFPSRYREPHVRGGSIFTGSTGLYYDVRLNPGQVFPDGGLTLSINYELNGAPNTYVTTITADLLPVERFLVDQIDDDFNSITIGSVTGTLTDPANAAISTYNIYRDVLSSTMVNGSILRNLGIQFSNIEYPHPNIVGHYFVRGARDNQNRTILDKGIANNLRRKTVNGVAYTGFSYFNGDVNELTLDNYLFTPRFLFNREALVGDYLKYENEFVLESTFISSDTINGTGSIFSELDTKIETRFQGYNGISTNNGDQNFKVNKSIILDATTKTITFEDANTPVYNLSWSNRVHVVQTVSVLPRPDKNIPYVSYKIDQNVHPVLSEITYQRMHNCLLTPDNTNRVFGGDTFINNFSLCNSLYRTQKKGVLTALLSIVLIAAAVVATIVTAGVTAPLIASAIGLATAAGIESAIVITALVAGTIGVTGQTIEAITGELNGDLENLTFDRDLANATGRGWTLSSYVSYANEFLQSLYVESEVNVGLRQYENHVCGQFYRIGGESIQNYFKNRWMYFDQETNAYQPKGFCCPETYHYNKDFSRQNTQSVYFPLPSTYDCCSNCVESHPDRIHYSEESFQEEISDNYKIFLPNNYRDIESEHGEITNIIKRNNNLFIHTSEALWALPQSQQERVTNELITFIGTGEFFSIPPKKIEDDELGSVGSQHKWATLNTSVGLLIVNQIDNEIIIYNDKFDRISDKGNQRWFRNNLQDFFANQFYQITGVKFPNENNPANPYGIGIHSTYDKKYERILITKLDYLLLPQFVSEFRIVSTDDGVLPTELGVNRLVFDMTTSKFILTGETTSSYTLINFNNTHYFQSKSWTYSYSIEDKGWVSWHSYIPNFYLYNHKDFYSMIATSNDIWKHNILGSFLTYYGNSYAHIIEMVLRGDNPSETRYWDDVSLQTVAKKYNPDSQEFYDQRFITFNRLLAYNSRQATGVQTLIPKDEFSDLDFMPDSLEQNLGEIQITRKERDWNLNDIRDYRTDYDSPLFSKAWNLMLGSYYIDKILDQTMIDYNKDWTQLEVLRDKFIVLRFIFDNFTDIQLSTNYISNTSGESVR
jgi:hypothetical protein